MKNKIIHILALSVLFQLLICPTSSAQIKKSPRLTQNPNELFAFLDSAQALATKEPYRAIDFVNKALEISITNNDKTAEALSYKTLGSIQQQLGHNDLAISNFQKAIDILETKQKSLTSYSSFGNSNIDLFEVYRLISISLSSMGKHNDALVKISKCFDNSFSGIPHNYIIAAKKVKADILLKQGKFNESLNICNEILKEEKANKNLNGEIDILNQIGDLYFAKGNENSALEYYNKAKAIADKTSDNDRQTKSSNRIAKVFSKQKKFDNEAEVRQQNVSSKSMKSAADISRENIAIGNAYVQADKLEEALPYYEKGLEQEQVVFKNSGSNSAQDNNQEEEKLVEEKVNAYKLLTEEYIKKGDLTKARENLNKYKFYQDSLTRIREIEMLKAVELSKDLGKNQQRIELLERERQLNEKAILLLKQDQQLKEEELSSRNMVIAGLFLCLIVMGFAGYFMVKSGKEKRKANQMLALKSLRGQMNPHFIFNALNSVNHYVSQNDERSANKYLSDFSKLMRSVLDISKHDFIPLSEEIEILKLYLQLEHARFSEKFEYEFIINEEAENAAFEIQPMLIQPYIENAVWHGLRYIDGTGFLKVLFELEPKGLAVTIEDNGIGRKRSKELKTKNQMKQMSTGMQNIENRIKISNELFKNKISVEIVDMDENQENTGTVVKIFIPR